MLLSLSWCTEGFFGNSNQMVFKVKGVVNVDSWLEFTGLNKTILFSKCSTDQLLKALVNTAYFFFLIRKKFAHFICFFQVIWKLLFHLLTVVDSPVACSNKESRHCGFQDISETNPSITLIVSSSQYFGSFGLSNAVNL